MPNSGIEAIKDEVVFFMEKTFQFSFVYVGALFATLAGANSDLIQELSTQTKSSPFVLVIAAILLLNVIYLIVACSNGFAILKRGYFILLQQEENTEKPLILKWENFVRNGTGEFGILGWNVDNYYVVIIYIIAFLMSAGFASYGIINSSGGVKIIIIFLTLTHLIPVWALTQLVKLNSVCHQNLPSQVSKSLPNDTQEEPS